MKKNSPNIVTLKRVNSLLLVAILLVNAYLIVMPFVPALLFSIQKHGHTEQRLEQKISSPVPNGDSDAKLNQPNQLIIPAMLYDHVINEGKTMAALHTGPWRRPNTSTPALGGNTVIAGHRFTYTNPRGTFYYLDKVRVGGTVTVHGQRQASHYVARVMDQGPGIASKDAPHIFERLYRGDKARTGAGGYGLGLSLALEIAQANHAQLLLDTSVKKGACFEIRFDLA